MASFPPLRNRRPGQLEARTNPEAEVADKRPPWLIGPVVMLLADGTERPATDREVEAICLPERPGHVRIEEDASGRRRTLIYEIPERRRGEMFGDSNEALGPQFAVADTHAARDAFDEFTRNALRRSGAELKE